MYSTVLFLFAALVTQAQQIKLSIVDKDSRQSVPYVYANVYLQNTLKQTVQADDKGDMTLNLETFPCRIELVTIGYEPFTLTYSAAPATATIRVQLHKKNSSLSEVIVTGVAEPTRLKDALSNYQVITQATIRAQGAVSLNDVLKNQLNMSVSNDVILGSKVNMQVAGSDKVKILVDGIPVNGRENGSINLSQLNMNNVDHIETAQGPMSVVYGSDAVGGVINIITKKENKPFDINIKGYYESVGRYNSTASMTFKLLKRHQITFGGGRNMFTGYENIDQPIEYNGHIQNTNRSYYFKPNLQNIANFAYSYRAPSGFKIDLASDYVKDKITNKGSLQAWDPFKGAYAIDEYYTTDRAINRLSLSGKLGNSGKWNMQNGLAYYNHVKNQYYINMVSMDRQLTPSMNQDSSVYNDVSYRGNYSNHVLKLNYTAGYDVNVQYASSTRIANHTNRIEDYALYTTLSYPLIKDRLTVQGGVRAALNSKYNPPVIPTLSLLYKPINNLQVRGSYSQGYRAATLKEMYLSFIDGTHYIIGNPKLQAEQSQHVQLSASYQVYEKQRDYLQFIITSYYNDIMRGIALVPMDTTDSLNPKYNYVNITHQSNLINTIQTDGQYKNVHFRLGYSLKHTFAEVKLLPPYNMHG
jgi:outer membrane receptor for ferrienterochelin and colicins